MSTKIQVLELLERNRGKNLSGEDLGRVLSVSRTAIWKAIKELKKEGYQIESVTNKGYCLSNDTNILSAQGMLPYLANQEHATNIHLFKAVESTNQTAKKMALDGAEHGTIVIAEHQIAGKGRMGRSFFSPEGSGIYMSFILRPESLPISRATLVTTAASVAVCNAIDLVLNKQAQIKWVNDIYLDGKKVCGILTEAISDFESGAVEWMILGIGLNFSTQTKDFPLELRHIAGSLCSEGSNGAARNHFAAEIVNQILQMSSWSVDKSFLEDYKKRSMVLGKTIKVIQPHETYQAIALDIDEDGRLIVKKEDGQIVVLHSGEVSIRNLEG